MKGYLVDSTGEMWTKEEIMQEAKGCDILEQFETYEEWFDEMVNTGFYKYGELAVYDNREEKVIKKISSYGEGNKIIDEIGQEYDMFNGHRYTIVYIPEE